PPRRRRRGETPAPLDEQPAVAVEEVEEFDEVVEVPLNAPEESREDSVSENIPETPDGAVKLFVNRGSRSGITEEDLRWALREGAVLEDEQVADVRVLERFSFVEVNGDVAERTVEFLDGTRLKGSGIRVEVARS
ncbi:MAG TPA: DbpA RNA binding domain-containing protein, partial [Solirubrobacterales bacterium]|nr:DbpA RNA binding domain-containing protein [Solirubrobacterales bacterium]